MKSKFQNLLPRRIRLWRTNGKPMPNDSMTKLVIRILDLI